MTVSAFVNWKSEKRSKKLLSRNLNTLLSLSPSRKLHTPHMLSHADFVRTKSGARACVICNTILRPAAIKGGFRRRAGHGHNENLIAL